MISILFRVELTTEGENRDTLSGVDTVMIHRVGISILYSRSHESALNPEKTVKSSSSSCQQVLCCGALFVQPELPTTVATIQGQGWLVIALDVWSIQWVSE